jgi:hypothetical protein
VQDGLLRFTDLSSHQEVGQLQQDHGDTVASVCGNPAQPHLAYASVGQAILELDLRKVLQPCRLGTVAT